MLCKCQSVLASEKNKNSSTGTMANVSLLAQRELIQRMATCYWVVGVVRQKVL